MGSAGEWVGTGCWPWARGQLRQRADPRLIGHLAVLGRALRQVGHSLVELHHSCAPSAGFPASQPMQDQREVTKGLAGGKEGINSRFLVRISHHDCSSLESVLLYFDILWLGNQPLPRSLRPPKRPISSSGPDCLFLPILAVYLVST